MRVSELFVDNFLLWCRSRLNNIYANFVALQCFGIGTTGDARQHDILTHTNTVHNMEHLEPLWLYAVAYNWALNKYVWFVYCVCALRRLSRLLMQSKRLFTNLKLNFGFSQESWLRIAFNDIENSLRTHKVKHFIAFTVRRWNDRGKRFTECAFAYIASPSDLNTNQ